MKSIKAIILLTLIFLIQSLEAQEKLEREYRIRKDIVPLKARTFIKSLSFLHTVKWYGEESLNGKSIEAKTKHNRRKYSIEFDTQGNLQDVEIEISKTKISNEAFKNILLNLEKEFVTFKIIKIQKQLTGSEKDIKKYIIDNIRNDVILKYEIVLKGKKSKGKQLYEFTFSEKGNLEKKEKIIFRNTDHLEY